MVLALPATVVGAIFGRLVCNTVATPQKYIARRTWSERLVGHAQWVVASTPPSIINLPPDWRGSVGHRAAAGVLLDASVWHAGRSSADRRRPTGGQRHRTT